MELHRNELEIALVACQRDPTNSKILESVRQALGDLLIETVDGISPSLLGSWEKNQLSYAISMLAANIVAWEATTFGLRRCLRVIDEVPFPRNRDPEIRILPDSEVEALTHERLLNAAVVIRSRL